ncbi:hypothetical protein J3T26_24040 [Salmonella enterica]|uniref:hypothetical protein n=1 Tax=Salmonella enterica TaxID=28901 RepID=UPI0021D487E6|nr:hypothetical protein [Salmonella enterica]MCU7123735.1 hypothetical protein [Salmonella enterica]
MKTSLALLQGILYALLGGGYCYVGWRLVSYAMIHLAPDVLACVLFIGGGIMLMTLILIPLAFFLQPVIALIAGVFALVGSLIEWLLNRRRSHA